VVLTILLSLLLSLPAQAGPRTEVVAVGVHLEGQTEAEAHRTTVKLMSVIQRQGGLQAVSPEQVRARVRGRGDQILDDALNGEGRDLLAEGRLLFEQADLEPARQRLQAAVVALDGAMAGTIDGRPLIDSLLLLGLVQISMGEADTARQIYKRVLRMDPTRQLDPVHYPPKVVALFSEVRQAVLAAPRAAMVITASDPTARIYVDGRLRGTGNVVVEDLITGPHHLLLSSQSGHRSYKSITVSPGAKKKITAQLTRRFVGLAAPSAQSRSRQCADLYRALGDRVTGGLVLLAGELGQGRVGVQLFEPRTGNFSKMLTAGGDGDPVGEILTLAGRLGSAVNDSGVLRPEQVGEQALPLDIGSNPVLAEVLLDSRSASERGAVPSSRRVLGRSKTPWYVWAGVGVLVAGATGAAFSLQGDSSSVKTPDPEPTRSSGTGTVVLRMP
jgi:hypothetical protein